MPPPRNPCGRAGPWPPLSRPGTQTSAHSMGTTGRQESVADVDTLAAFDFAAFFAAVDDARRERDMRWYGLAAKWWDQSAQLNAERSDHPLCGGAVSRLGARGETSCQYALYLLRWLRRAPEEFLTGPALGGGDVRL